jgi:hypothetical protein
VWSWTISSFERTEHEINFRRRQVSDVSGSYQSVDHHFDAKHPVGALSD